MHIDLELVRLAKSIASGRSENRVSCRSIRQNLQTINRELVRQTKPDVDKRDELLKLTKKLNYTPDDDTDVRIRNAKKFMTKRQSLENL